MANQFVQAESEVSASYMRSLADHEALDAKEKIDRFFGKIASVPAPRKPKMKTVRPIEAYWFAVAGGCLLIASVVTIAFRHRLPEGNQGLYLGLAGLALLAIGVIWLRLRTRQVPIAEKAENALKAATDLFDKQISQVERHADATFGPLHPQGHRVLLQGIGKKEWAGNEDVMIREAGEERIYASVLQLVAIDLTPDFLTILQYGLHLPTGTICEQSSIRRPLDEILDASQVSARAVAAGAWERAEQITRELKGLRQRNNLGVRNDGRIERRLKELESLRYDQVSSHDFVIDFLGGRQLKLVVASKDFAKNTSLAAYPVGGPQNVRKAVEAWNAINAARTAAETAQRQYRDQMCSNADETKAALRSLNDGLANVSEGFSGLEAALAASISEPQAGVSPLHKNRPISRAKVTRRRPLILLNHAGHAVSHVNDAKADTKGKPNPVDTASTSSKDA